MLDAPRADAVRIDGTLEVFATFRAAPPFFLRIQVAGVRALRERAEPVAPAQPGIDGEAPPTMSTAAKDLFWPRIIHATES